MNRHFVHIDIAKGIGILMIALGHNVITTNELYLILHSFNLPLFFFLSGLFFNPDITFSRLCVIKSDRLLKPYFSFMLLGAIYILYRGCSPVDYFLYILSGTSEPLWFLPHLWVVFLFSWILVKLTKFDRRRLIEMAIIMTVLFIVGLFCLHIFRNTAVMTNLPHVVFGSPLWSARSQIIIPPGYPFSADIVMLTACYFLMGFVFKKQVVKFHFSIPAFILGIGVFAACHYFFNYTVNFYIGVFDHPIISLLESISGIYVVLSISYMVYRHFSKIAKILTYIGNGSLFIYIFHNYIQGGIYLLLEMKTEWPDVFNGTLGYIIGCALPLLFWEIIKRNKYLSAFWLPFRKNRTTTVV